MGRGKGGDVMTDSQQNGNLSLFVCFSVCFSVCLFSFLLSRPLNMHNFTTPLERLILPSRTWVEYAKKRAILTLKSNPNFSNLAEQG